MSKHKPSTPMGRLAQRVERISARGWLPLPNFLVETLSRSGSSLLANLGPGKDDGVEERMRGVLTAGALRATGLRIGRGVVLRGRDRIEIGDRVSLADGVFLSATGTRGRITIGAGTHLDVRCVIYGQGGLSIGRGCAIASGVTIYSQTNQYDAESPETILEQGTHYAPVSIGDDVWIGARAVVIPGVSVGSHAVIAAGAVVVRDVEPGAVVAGVPARVIKHRRFS